MDLSNVHDLDSFRVEIENAATKIPLDEIQRSIDAFTSRVRKVEEQNGGYPYK